MRLAPLTGRSLDYRTETAAKPTPGSFRRPAHVQGRHVLRLLSGLVCRLPRLIHRAQ